MNAPQSAIAEIQSDSPTQVLFKVKQLAKVEPSLGVGSIRNDLFHRKTNGLEASGAIIRRGRHLLIHRELYLTWLMTQK